MITNFLTLKKPLYVANLSFSIFASLTMTLSSSSIALATDLVPKDPANEHFEDDIADDDLDFTYEFKDITLVSKNETLMINQKYDMCYHVLSSDKADVEILSFFGQSAPDSTYDFDLQLSDCMGNLIGSKISRTGEEFSETGITVALSENDVLGSLEGLMIGDFHITLKVTRGTIGLTGYTFNWEVDDIEKKPMPPTPTPEPLTILGSATALGFGAFFKRKRKSS